MRDVKKVINEVEVEEMARQVSIGSQSFENLREKGCFYIDKTYFIRDWWKTEDQITLITRPRRFGKTLNMNMLECFFSDRYAGRLDFFKTNPYLGRAVMTGITRVSKESMFSDLNNPNVCTVAVDQYATAFGFTEEEVFASMDEFDMGSEKEKMGVKNWYDGFTIGNHHDIYNPWSITNFLRQKVFKTYWVNTSSNGMAGSVLQQADKNVKVLFEQLMQGKSIDVEMNDEMIFSQLGEKDEAIWARLLCSGYLMAE